MEMVMTKRQHRRRIHGSIMDEVPALPSGVMCLCKQMSRVGQALLDAYRLGHPEESDSWEDDAWAGSRYTPRPSPDRKPGEPSYPE